VLGYIGLASSEPFNRSELLEAWWRQELFDKHLVIRVGKSNPAIDFQDVMRPVTNPHAERVISTVTSLLYGPIFVLPTLYESLPAFYETAYGITSTWIPSERFYVSYGVYDGNKARGVATGLTGPEFNGYYFHIAEAGTNWLLGAEQKPGFFSVGGWRQTVVAYYYGDVDPGTADLGFYGFNGVLTAVAVFVVCGGKLRLSILGALIATMMIPAITGLGLQMVSAPYVFTTWLILGLGWIEDHWFDVGAEPEPIPAAKSHASARPAHGHTGN